MAKTSNKSPGKIDKAVAAKIRTARLEAGLSQTNLGDEIGVSFQQIQKYEKGLNRIAPDRLQRIAAKTGRPITFFFTDGFADPTASDTETLDRLINWMRACPPARSILSVLPSLNEANAAVVATIVEALAQRRA